jgi:erythritol transport system ATP-binding protein
MTDANPIGLSIRNGSKIYPGTQALKNVDFDLRMGAVNVLVGENGAGKSTLMKIIAGVEQLNGGTIEIDGQQVVFADKTDAAKHGVGIVFQELNLFPNLTVAENIFVGHEKTRAGIHIDSQAQRTAAAALMKRLEQNIDPDTPLGNLRIGQQQIVEIAKALA